MPVRIPAIETSGRTRGKTLASGKASVAEKVGPNNDNHGGGPRSSHQGGSHGHATRSQGKSNSDTTHEPGEPTNPDRSRVSGGGAERDRHHVHDPKNKS